MMPKKPNPGHQTSEDGVVDVNDEIYLKNLTSGNLTNGYCLGKGSCNVTFQVLGG